MKALERYLDSFGKSVVQKSKENLKSDKGSTTLGTSIRSEVTKQANGYSIKFYMLDYGTFLDKGVSGNKVKRNYINIKGKSEKSPYSYTTKGPPIDIISKWIKKKGIEPKGLGRGRSKTTGQYVSGFAYLISRKIKREGIPSLSFFSKPLSMKYSTFNSDVLKALKLDITSYITTFTKQK
tara:strand:- start:1363 stop:1902 length:540 start_codon:yes stop_codon:yes gene_type:complete